MKIKHWTIIILLSIIFCCFAILFVFLLNNKVLEMNSYLYTYNDSVFAVVSNTKKESLYDYDVDKLSNGSEDLKEFPNNNIVCEISNVHDTGNLLTDDEYYCILYKDKTIKYIKGNMDAFVTVSNNINSKIDELYTKYSPIVLSVYNGYIEETKRLSNLEYLILLKKLEKAKNICPYNDSFIIDTSHSFCGFYFDDKYFGNGPPEYKDKKINRKEFENGCNIFNDVLNYVGKLVN